MHAQARYVVPPPAMPGPFKLSNKGGGHFQRGQLDVFLISDAPDVGQLKQVGAGRVGCLLAWVCLHGPSGVLGWVQASCTCPPPGSLASASRASAHTQRPHIG